MQLHVQHPALHKQQLSEQLAQAALSAASQGSTPAGSAGVPGGSGAAPAGGVALQLVKVLQQQVGNLEARLAAQEKQRQVLKKVFALFLLLLHIFLIVLSWPYHLNCYKSVCLPAPLPWVSAFSVVSVCESCIWGGPQEGLSPLTSAPLDQFSCDAAADCQTCMASYLHGRPFSPMCWPLHLLSLLPLPPPPPPPPTTQLPHSS